MMDKPTQEQLDYLRHTAQALRLIKRKDNEHLIQIRIAYHPYVSTQAFFQMTAEISRVWQKLLCLVSMDSEFVEGTFKQIAESDPLIKHLLALFKIRKGVQAEQDIILNRCDYFKNTKGEAKIIEYNLSAVSMTAHAQNISEAKRLTDWERKGQYPDNTPQDKLIGQIAAMFKSGGFKGITLMITAQNETNTVEITQIELGLLRTGIKVRRSTLCEVAERAKVGQDGQLYYDGELVSFAYYRTGYRWEDYLPELETRWKARRIIEESKAVRMPSVSMDLINQKRLQVQISKPEVYKKYLNEEEATLLEKSLVQFHEFDHMPEETYAKLSEGLKSNPDLFILKPNAEGGGNNFYGQDVIDKLKALSPNERKNFILMEKIESEPIHNLLLDGSTTFEGECEAEVSHYSVVRTENGKIVENQVIGHLVRVKPTSVNQAGIMSGAGSLCAWMTQ